jgi:LacI family transcriptional regulator
MAQKSARSAPTLVHVARLAGVGLGTASRALSGEGYVGKETLARIHAAVERLGYQRNELARSLKTNRTYVIGIVVPDIGGLFMVELIRAAQGVLRQHRYMSVIAFTDGNSDIEKEEVEYLLRRQIDGLLVVPEDSSASYLSSLQTANVPVVFFDQPVSDKDFDAVLVKNRHGARAAVQHLIDHGHQRIAAVGVNPHLYSMKKRIEGYREAMKQAGLREQLVVTRPEDIDRQVDEWLGMKAPPTAIFGLNELSSIKAIEALLARKVRMPEQMAFIGFDEIQLGRFVDPPLTAVRQPAAMIGEQAANRLLERIEAKEPLPGKHIMLDTLLIQRRSCGCNGC